MAARMTVRRLVLEFGDRQVSADLAVRGEQRTVTVAGREVPVRLEPLGEPLVAVWLGDRRVLARYVSAGGEHQLHVDGVAYRFRVGRFPAARSSAAGPAGPAPHHRDFQAPMPGVLTRVFVEEGQRLEAGDALFAVEAMKMEHVVRTPHPGRVARVLARAGDQVEAGAVIVEVDGERP